jgi:hypothetical protein
MKPKINRIAATGVLLLFFAGAATVTAEHVDPTFVPFNAGPALKCSDFDKDWIQLKVEPPVSGNYSDGTLNVTIDVMENDESEAASFNWTSNIGVAAVFVVDGAFGHHLYEYDPAATADDGLTAGPKTTPHGGFAEISHILFCYMEAGDDETPDDEDPVPEKCPPGTLSATPNGDGSITVQVSDLEVNATLMRSDGGDFEAVASFNATSDTYLDTDTEVGVTYTYQLVIGREVCDEIEVTAIPVFPGLIAAALATGLGVLGYIGLRRRS